MKAARGAVAARKAALDQEIARLERRLAAMDRRVADQEARLRALTKLTEGQKRRQDAILEALALGERPRKGDRGVVRDIQESIGRLEDYLLRTSDRIENILTALKQHRELLVGVNRRVLDVGTKDRIRLELDVMKNTLSILALHGIEVDIALVKDIEKLRQTLQGSADVAGLEKAKAELDKKFDGELKKFDLDAIWSKRKEIPGYG